MDLPPQEIEYEEAHISDDDSATIATVVAVCSFVAFIAVTLRLVFRRLRHQHLQKGDYMAVVALAFTIALSVTIGIGLSAGLGKHVIFLSNTAPFTKPSKQSLIATNVIFITSLIPLKLSLIFFYHQFATTCLQSRTLWFLGIWVVGMGIAGDITTLLNCANAPIIDIGAHCISYKGAVLSHGGQDALTNLIILCWPVPFIWGAKMSRTRKFHLLGVFALGASACAASIIRLIYSTNENLLDQTWSSTAPTIWSTLELALGLTATSLAPLSPLLHYALPTYAQATSTSGNRNHSFISDTETAVATTPYPPTIATPTTVTGGFGSTSAAGGSSSGNRTRAFSFKDPAAPATPSTPSKWKNLLAKNKSGSGASSPGFTWRCSGRVEDLEKWKALPPPPPVPGVPESAALAGPASPRAGPAEMEESEEGFAAEPLFRAVHYGGNI